MPHHGYPHSDTAGTPAYAWTPAAAVAAPPPPERLHWANWLVVAGAGGMLVALLAVILGVPAALFYDENAPGERQLYDGHDPLRLSQSIDGNMKYIKEQTSYGDDKYNGLLTSLDTSQSVVPGMAQKLEQMNGAVVSIDNGLGAMLEATKKMSVDMATMAATSADSKQTMEQVAADLASLSATMKQLYGESAELDAAMKRIEKKAGVIASDRTGPAVKNTRELGAVLPHDVPAPNTSLDPDPAGQPR